MDLATTRTKTDRLLTAWNHAKRAATEEIKRLDAVQQELTDAEVAQRLIQAAAEATQRIAHQRITAVTTSCLQSVFGAGAYEFRLVFEQKRGRTEARPVFIRAGHELDPRDQSGGGCIAVAAMSLRISKLIMTRPARRRLLVLDEPFIHLSPEYRDLVPPLLDSLANELNLQIIMATNQPEYVTGTVVRLG